MKVILLKDVPRLGKRFDVKEVSDGHAANFLFPQKLAEPATSAKVREIEGKRAAKEGERALAENLLARAIRAIDGERFTLTARANEQGHLFEGIHKDAVAQAIQGAERTPIGEEHIVLAHPIKTVGEHPISIVSGKMKVIVTLVVEAE